MNKLYKYFTPKTFNLSELVNNFVKELLEKEKDIPENQKEKAKSELQDRIKIAVYLSGRITKKNIQIPKEKKVKEKEIKQVRIERKEKPKEKAELPSFIKSQKELRDMFKAKA